MEQDPWVAEDWEEEHKAWAQVETAYVQIVGIGSHINLQYRAIDENAQNAVHL